jgi:predicted anti-sigma-YlaC factor YlaD
MACEDHREALSAGLDGESIEVERARAEAHLVGCSACRDWLDAAALLNRLARTSVVSAGRPIDERLLAELPRWRWERWPGRWLGRPVVMLRAVLVLVGAFQLLLGIAQLAVYRAGAAGHVHDLGGGLAADSGHLWHEAAAWNIAVGAGFVWVALSRSRPAGVVPMLTAFIGVLTLLTVDDVADGSVRASRVVSHSVLLAGYVLVVILSRVAPETGRPSSDGRPASWWLRIPGAIGLADRVRLGHVGPQVSNRIEEPAGRRSSAA